MLILSHVLELFTDSFFVFDVIFTGLSLVLSAIVLNVSKLRKEPPYFLKKAREDKKSHSKLHRSIHRNYIEIDKIVRVQMIDVVMINLFVLVVY